MARSALLLFICFLFFKIISCDGQRCVQENPCLCRFNELQKINLWPLTGNTPGGLFTTAVLKTAKYFFRICEDYQGKPVKCGFNKTNTATPVTCDPPFSLCKCDAVSNTSTVLGLIKHRSFADVATEKNTEKFVYTQGNNVTASVLLACSELNGNYLYPLANNGTNDQLIFFTEYACVTNDEPGISTGTTLLIIFFFFLVFYFVFGALLLHFIRGARGMEMIPNLEFWKDLPYLVRDGIVFLLSGCKPTALVTSEAYDRI